MGAGDGFIGRRQQAGAALGTLLAGDFGGILGAAVSFALSLFYVRMRSHDASGKFSERPYIVSLP